jgi:hypothetical protein
VFDDRCNEVIKLVYRLMSGTIDIPADILSLIRSRCLIVPSNLWTSRAVNIHLASHVKPSHELDHIETGRKLYIMSTITPIDYHELGRKM